MKRLPAALFILLFCVTLSTGTPSSRAMAMSVPADVPKPSPNEESTDETAVPSEAVPSDDIVYEGTGQDVIFSHKEHVLDFGQACGNCHTSIFELRANSAKESGDFTMKGLDAGKFCGACHNGSIAFSTTDFEQCERCHAGKDKATVTGKPVEGPKADIMLGSDDSVAIFKHSFHGSVDCSECHTRIFPMKKTKTITTMDDISNKKACGVCHNGGRAFAPTECGKCHPKM